MRKSYRFRSFAVSISMVLEHVKQWVLIRGSISIHLHRITNTGPSWSAACCPLFVFKVRKGFPSEQLGFWVVARLLLLQVLFISLDLQIKFIFIGERKFSCWKHFRAWDPAFLQVKWPSVVAAGGSLLPRVRASIWKVVNKMSTRL